MDFNQYVEGYILNIRSVLDLDEKALLNFLEALFDFLKDRPDITKLHLTSSNLGNEGAKIVAKRLKEVPHLQVLNLSGNNIEYEGAEDIATHLKEVPHLQVLDLSGNNIGNYGTVVITVKLKKMLKLHTLDLSGNNISCKNMKGEEDVEEVAKVKAIAVNLGEIPNLRVLSLSRNNFKVEGAKAMAEHLKEASNLQELYLSESNLRNTGTAAITATLKEMPKLRILDLNGNNICNNGSREHGSKDIEVIIADLKEVSHLQDLDLSGNFFGNRGAKALTALTELKELGLSSCGRISLKDIEELHKKLPNCTMYTDHGTFGPSVPDQTNKKEEPTVESTDGIALQDSTDTHSNVDNQNHTAPADTHGNVNNQNHTTPAQPDISTNGYNHPSTPHNSSRKYYIGGGMAVILLIAGAGIACFVTGNPIIGGVFMAVVMVAILVLGIVECCKSSKKSSAVLGSTNTIPCSNQGPSIE
ncbi:leucine-rich repeat domain-containing protein [Wolbachia endosymbiont of Ctenocephalides felis wCfeT]|uniref:leucine-rich repeat domain-containing protein n=1 Tax=Wolbachia endosymbiont of Ctenocephalides felis wCfeT TaxID=2732593 RepID=UPI001447DE7E|nr:hypothetical protein [Wolbachia endosymbiont of Ctenocephalides felis wCfeT]